MLPDAWKPWAGGKPKRNYASDSNENTDFALAMEDLAAGRSFHEYQEQGVGDYFLDSLFADIDSLAIYAGIHEMAFGFYRLLAKRFPYSIYYKIIGDETLIFRVLDCRRDPNWIDKALSEKPPPE